MTTTRSARTSLRNRILCALAATVLTLATPFALAQSNAQPPTTPSGKPLAFTIVSIKRHGNVSEREGNEGCYVDSCHFVDRPLLAFIMVAYNLSQQPIHGDPLAGDSDLFDLNAKIDPADLPTTPAHLPPARRHVAACARRSLPSPSSLRVAHPPRLQHRPRQRRFENEAIRATRPRQARIARWHASRKLLPHICRQWHTR